MRSLQANKPNTQKMRLHRATILTTDLIKKLCNLPKTCVPHRLHQLRKDITIRQSNGAKFFKGLLGRVGVGTFKASRLSN